MSLSTKPVVSLEHSMWTLTPNKNTHNPEAYLIKDFRLKKKKKQTVHPGARDSTGGRALALTTAKKQQKETGNLYRLIEPQHNPKHSPCFANKENRFQGTPPRSSSW